MATNNEYQNYLSQKKPSEIRNAAMLSAMWNGKSYFKRLFNSKEPSDRQLATRWLLRARAVFTPTILEQVATRFADGVHLMQSGAIDIGERMVSESLEQAMENELFELALLITEKIDDEFNVQAKARYCLTEIWTLQGLLRQVRDVKGLRELSERKAALGLIKSHIALQHQPLSSRAQQLQMACQLRIHVFLKDFDAALEVAATLSNHANASNADEDLLMAQIEIAHLYLVTGDLRQAELQVGRLSLIDLCQKRLVIIRHIEQAILSLLMGLEFGNRQEGIRGLSLVTVFDHDQYSKEPRHAFACALAVTFSTVAGLPAKGIAVIEANLTRIKKEKEYHWLEISMAGHYLIHYDWEVLTRIGKRLQKAPISPMGEFIAALIKALHAGEVRTESDRRQVFQRFLDRSQNLGADQIARYPIDQLLRLRLGNQNAGGNKQVASGIA